MADQHQGWSSTSQASSNAGWEVTFAVLTIYFTALLVAMASVALSPRCRLGFSSRSTRQSPTSWSPDSRHAARSRLASSQLPQNPVRQLRRPCGFPDPSYVVRGVPEVATQDRHLTSPAVIIFYSPSTRAVIDFNILSSSFPAIFSIHSDVHANVLIG